MDAQIRRERDEGDDIESDRADGVLQRLTWGVDGIDKVGNAEFGAFVQKKNGRMKDGQGESDVPAEVMEAEIVEAAMRPLAHGAVTKNHEGAEEHVERDGADGCEADVRGEVKDGDWHE